ncbi:TPA: hypothetical protein P0E35_005152 [Vibrio harveyi]|nr:hypothetical protein [Vibrio harveyi]
MTTTTDLSSLYRDKKHIYSHIETEIVNWTAINILGKSSPCFYSNPFPILSKVLSGNCLPVHIILRKYLLDNYSWIKSAHIEIGVTETLEKPLFKKDRASIKKLYLQNKNTNLGKLTYFYFKDKFHVWVKIYHTNGSVHILDMTSFPEDPFTSEMIYSPILTSRSSQLEFLLEFTLDYLRGVKNPNLFVSNTVQKYSL